MQERLLRPRRWAPTIVRCAAAASWIATGTTLLGADYTGHRLVQVSIDSWRDFEKMEAISPQFLSCSPRIGEVPFAVPAEKLDALEAIGLDYRIVHDNIQALIDREKATHAADGGEWFSDYHPYDSVNAYLASLATLRPDLAGLITIGASVEGRPIQGIRIGAPGLAPGAPAILIHGCQHAREWISVSVPVYVADRLVRSHDSDPAVQALLQRATFYVVPVANPDGYVFSWDDNRLWRKNRRPNGGGSFGVDNNRNWGYQWGLTPGSSGNPNSETYRGPSPFSEPETQALRDFISAHPEIVAHLDVHSYGQYVMSPWGYVAAAPPPPDGATFQHLSHLMGQTILGVHGEHYTVGPVGEVLYLASGNSIDWVYGARDILSWTIELRDTGGFGFILPASQILPTCQEAYAAVAALGNAVTSPLSFAFPGGVPHQVVAGAPTPIIVEVHSMQETLAPASPKVFYRVGSGGGFVSAALAELGDGAYEATLPAAACGQTWEFYFEAETTLGSKVRSPADAPAAVYAASAVTISVVLEDAFEVVSGWTVGAPGDDATRGIWNRMDPQGTAAQPEDDHTPPPGVACWVTDGNAGSALGDFDVDGGRTTLLSPAYDLSAAPGAYISYWRWYSNDKGGAPQSDVFVVDITNDGTTWVNVETVGPAGPAAVGGWLFHRFRVADFVAPTIGVRLRFVASDLGPGSIIEAAIDDLRIESVGCPAPPCPADLDGDGVVSQADLGILLANYGCQTDPRPGPPIPCAGDIDGDGDIDQADLGLMLSAYGTTCP
jgi:murein tripeptide amidase MpaA